MQRRTLSVDDKALFDRAVASGRHELAAYAFANVFIWQRLCRITRAEVHGCLCIFFEDASGSYLYLPPLGRTLRRETVDELFAFLDKENPAPGASRIENVQEDAVSLFRSWGYTVREKPGDYLYARERLVQLQGNDFKGQRASYNYFTKQYRSQPRAFSSGDAPACRALHEAWKKERKAHRDERVYQGMLDDSGICLEELLMHHGALEVTGQVVIVDGRLRAFTFGTRLSADTFCIIYEVADLSLKGLSAFIFREVCRSLSGFTYVNVMDDSGLENLRRAKESYHPLRVVPNYIVTRDA